MKKEVWKLLKDILNGEVRNSEQVDTRFNTLATKYGTEAIAVEWGKQVSELNSDDFAIVNAVTTFKEQEEAE